jgi:putative hemolysin
MQLKKSDLRTIIESKNPTFFKRLPDAVSRALLHTLERIVHLDELREFFALHGDKRNWDFIRAVFEYLDFSYTVPEEHLRRIPAEGRLICVANHSQGPLDGLIMLHLIGRVRKDVKIVLTDLLSRLDNLIDLFLLFDQYTSSLQKQNVLAIRQTLLGEHSVIFFPAGQVTKLTWRGIREHTWMTGPISCARKYEAPILPIAIDAYNSWVYYALSPLNRHLSTLLLSHEMFRKRSATIPIRVGELLPASLFTKPDIDIVAQSQRLREHVYRIRKGQSGISAL